MYVHHHHSVSSDVAVISFFLLLMLDPPPPPPSVAPMTSVVHLSSRGCGVSTLRHSKMPFLRAHHHARFNESTLASAMAQFFPVGRLMDARWSRFNKLSGSNQIILRCYRKLSYSSRGGRVWCRLCSFVAVGCCCWMLRAVILYHWRHYQAEWHNCTIYQSNNKTRPMR